MMTRRETENNDVNKKENIINRKRRDKTKKGNNTVRK